MYDSVIELITSTATISTASGIPYTTETTRVVYGQIDNVTRDEWSAAGQAGANPEFRISMPAINYRGEDACYIRGVRYAIYRTYASMGVIELYVEKKAGVTYGR